MTPNLYVPPHLWQRHIHEQGTWGVQLKVAGEGGGLASTARRCTRRGGASGVRGTARREFGEGGTVRQECWSGTHPCKSCRFWSTKRTRA